MAEGGPVTRHSSPVTRKEGWEARLNTVIEAARHEPYELGRHDCFRLACRVIEALTGVERWSEFGGYRTRREAILKLAQYGASFEAAGDWFFGRKRVDVKLARRGDIIAFSTLNGEKHLGICLGEETACLTPAGLSRIPTLDCICAWRVG